jgi:4-diphosphocytidyl-2-C-methyl-D-erythritol kinase
MIACLQHLLARFAPAKLNLFLEVAGLRPDGYHEIATIMETVAAGDFVEVAHARELIVTSTRPDVPSGEGNVAHKIVRAAEAALGRPLPARITIVKHVPPGSGLGAGSSDAVAALQLVLALHGIKAQRTTLVEIAAAVGSDTAFFLDGGVALCTGRGEIVRPLASPGFRHVVLVYPASECSTAKVYSALSAEGERRSPGRMLAAIARGSTLATAPDDALPFNRLEAAAASVYPGLVERRAFLESVAGRPPLLSGSGGTFYYLCPTQGEAKALAETIRSADRSLEVRHTASYRG